MSLQIVIINFYFSMSSVTPYLERHTTEVELLALCIALFEANKVKFARDGQNVYTSNFENYGPGSEARIATLRKTYDEAVTILAT